MAWLQNLAGRAEDLLNKIDKNAATVLNDSKLSDTEIQIDAIKPEVVENNGDVGSKLKCSSSSSDVSMNSSFFNFESPIKNKRKVDDRSNISDGVINFEVVSERQSSPSGSDCEDNFDKSGFSDKMSSASSINNSMILAEEVNVLQDKIESLTKENQQLNKQLLNIQHQYSQLSNESNSFRYQIESINKQLVEAQREKETYIARAQRILQEKEKTLFLQQSSSMTEETENMYATYNADLRKELEVERQRYEELLKKNSVLTSDMQSLLMQHQAIQNGLQATIHSLEQELENERRLRNYSDEDFMERNKLIISKEQETEYLTKCLEQKNEEIKKLHEQYQMQLNVTTSSEDVGEKIRSLTHTLMTKQHNLETTTTERNALRLQLEKIQSEYQRMMSQVNRSPDKTVLIEERDDSLPMPRFMRVSPFDAGVTRRVKRAYSTLDAVSIRTGSFLRRYPLARVFVFCYMVLLHIWVLVILFLYAPGPGMEKSTTR